MPEPIALPHIDEAVIDARGKMTPAWYAALKRIVASLNAAGISYNPATSGMIATTVQAAIDELEARVEVLE